MKGNSILVQMLELTQIVSSTLEKGFVRMFACRFDWSTVSSWVKTNSSIMKSTSICDRAAEADPGSPRAFHCKTQQQSSARWQQWESWNNRLPILQASSAMPSHIARANCDHFEYSCETKADNLHAAAKRLSTSIHSNSASISGAVYIGIENLHKIGSKSE